jgi:hypothetical protein
MYSPALVAFVPFTQSNQIGWVPLGPGDPYAPRYYNENWQPYYLSRTNVVQQRVINLDVPGAVTVVPVDNFTQIIDPRRVTRADRQTLAQVRPVLDPLTLTPLRNAVLHSAWGRGKIDLPPGIAKKLYNTPVLTSAAPLAPPFRKDLARDMRVEPVPERAKNQKLQLRDERQAEAGRTSDQAGQENDAARRQQLAAEAARGNKDARRQMQQLEQQQRQARIEQQNAERAAAKGKQQEQIQGERVGRPARQQVQKEGRQPQAQPNQPMRSIQPQQRSRQNVERPQAMQQMRQQPHQNAAERRGPPPQAQQPRQNVERKQGPPQAVQQMRQQPHQNAAERRGPPPQAQQPRQQQAERKQGSPAQPPVQSQGQGGKGKSKKP